MRRQTGMAGAFLAAFVLVATAGCLVSRNQSVTERGSAVTAVQMQAFQVGVTTPEDVTRALGSPEQRTKSDDGREVLTYSHERTVQSRLVVVFLLSWGGQKRKLTRYSFEFQDSLLVRQWQEDVL